MERLAGMIGRLTNEQEGMWEGSEREELNKGG